MKESDLVRDCLQWLVLKKVYSWRTNTVGIFNQKSGGYFFHGKKGVSDILGIVCQHYEGEKFGCLLAIECKKPKKEGGREPTEDQKNFLRCIERDGGISMVVRSVQELEEKLEGFLNVL